MTESQMLINYVPGEECRVAIVEDGRLEELFVEKFAHASRVGNIYVGKVANVEPAIQAAFVDFGVGENGFLHITDLHPRYFPGEDGETTERVGLKTPRRERPLIQQALRRGDEVIVQVLKEGVGTKGPTLTGYLSIPGRFLVMMPYMDKVGVSRKVEDEDARREMRKILDQLELPEGFGFILRTAGMDRTKTDLKRDLAYLQRLWKDMERRKNVGGKPRLLYSESDLLVRSLRDMLTTEINEVIIDNELAVQRASRFMKIVAPRSTTKLLHYPGKSPLFHAFNVEREVSLIHAREVPLPSGGRLVIDQTEALVAIDVNSGKSRESRDAETNAYQTNIEAVDEICRQLRLRDMGGIVVNDLIDMRRSEHRRDIENRFKERLKRDRAKSTVTQISEFGIIEMTRQRMRPSHESTHFTDCPTCRGRGLVQKPESVANDALRDLAAVLDVKKIAKVELAVSPRVAGELLSHKRQLLGRLERHFGKHVDVRVSETLAVDRVSFFAYDEAGADVDLGNLAQPVKPNDLIVIESPKARKGEDDDWSSSPDDEQRRALDAERAEEEESDGAGELETHPIEIDDEDDTIDQDWPEIDGGSNVNNRRRGRGPVKGRDAGRRPDARRPDDRRPPAPRSDDRRPPVSRPDDRRPPVARSDDRRPDPRRNDRPAPARRPESDRVPERPLEPALDRPADGRGPVDDRPRDGQESGEGGRRRRRRRGRRGGRAGDDRDERDDRNIAGTPARADGAGPAAPGDERVERNITDDRAGSDDRGPVADRPAPRQPEPRRGFRPLGAIRPEDDDDDLRISAQSGGTAKVADSGTAAGRTDLEGDRSDSDVSQRDPDGDVNSGERDGPDGPDGPIATGDGADGVRRRRRRRRGRGRGRENGFDGPGDDGAERDGQTTAQSGAPLRPLDDGNVTPPAIQRAPAAADRHEFMDDSRAEAPQSRRTGPDSENGPDGEVNRNPDVSNGRDGARSPERSERPERPGAPRGDSGPSDSRGPRRRGRGRDDGRPAPRADSRDGGRPPQRDDRPPRDGPRGGSRGGSRDRPRDGSRSGGEPRRESSGGDRAGSPPASTPASPPTPPAKPQVRTLYGAARRKLSPSELNKRPKPE
jgi:ribonuclease E